jgi:hypothetical protein
MMHQNLGRIDCIPQSQSIAADIRYIPAAYWVPVGEIDDPVLGLDLPPPVVIRSPGENPKSGSATAIENTDERFNRVILRGHDEAGVYYENVAETDAVQAGEEIALEYFEQNDKCTSAAKCQAHAEGMLAFFQLDQRSWEMTLMQRLVLELYQLIKFERHPKLPAVWCRITSLEKHVASMDDYASLTLIPDQALAAQRSLQRMLYPLQTSNISDVVTHALQRQAQAEPALATAQSGNMITVVLDSGPTVTARGR